MKTILLEFSLFPKNLHKLFTSRVSFISLLASENKIFKEKGNRKCFYKVNGPLVFISIFVFTIDYKFFCKQETKWI